MLFKNIFEIFRKNNNVYHVKLSEITVPSSFQKTPPKAEKMKKKWFYYRDNGEFESPIIIDNDFVLVDGYTSYLIAKEEHINFVPVFFE